MAGYFCLMYLYRRISIIALNDTAAELAAIIIISPRCMPYDIHSDTPNIKSIYIEGDTSSSLFVRIPFTI